MGLAQQPYSIPLQKVKNFFIEEDGDEVEMPKLKQVYQRQHWLFPESITQQEYNLPFHNYAGPGTRTKARIIDGDKPVNTLDAAALVHDVEYMSGLYDRADTNILNNLAQNAPSTFMPTLLAMKIKNMAGYKPKSNVKDYHAAMKMVLDKGLLNDYPSVTFDPELMALAGAISDNATAELIEPTAELIEPQVQFSEGTSGASGSF